MLIPIKAQMNLFGVDARKLVLHYRDLSSRVFGLAS